MEDSIIYPLLPTPYFLLLMPGTFPQKQPSYADVTAPELPGDLLARIEEIEQVIYQTEAMPAKTPPYDPFRRTYAFFEASTWLVNNYLVALLK